MVCATPCPVQTYGVCYLLRCVQYSSIVRATPCPVLTVRVAIGRRESRGARSSGYAPRHSRRPGTVLRACYAMSGTDRAYRATRALCRVRYCDIIPCCGVQYWHSVSCYAQCQCPVLRQCVALRYWRCVWCYACATRCPVLSYSVRRYQAARSVQSARELHGMLRHVTSASTESKGKGKGDKEAVKLKVAPYARATRCPVKEVVGGLTARRGLCCYAYNCYCMLLRRCVVLMWRAGTAVSGTDVAYDGTRHYCTTKGDREEYDPRFLVFEYQPAYGPTILLRDVRTLCTFCVLLCTARFCTARAAWYCRVCTGLRPVVAHLDTPGAGNAVLLYFVLETVCRFLLRVCTGRNTGGAGAPIRGVA
eukprot:3932466-Rhodomonas_salina.2